MRAGDRGSAARAVAPVAIPSSTTMTVRPARGTGARSPRNRRARTSTSARSRASTLASSSVPDAGEAHHVLVEDADAVLPDGAHAQFGLERHTQLADDDDVQGCAELARDLEGHRYASTRQRRRRPRRVTPAARRRPRQGDGPRRNGSRTSPGTCLPEGTQARVLLQDTGDRVVRPSHGQPYDRPEPTSPGLSGPRAWGKPGTTVRHAVVRCCREVGTCALRTPGTAERSSTCAEAVRTRG